MRHSSPSKRHPKMVIVLIAMLVIYHHIEVNQFKLNSRIEMEENPTTITYPSTRQLNFPILNQAQSRQIPVGNRPTKNLTTAYLNPALEEVLQAHPDEGDYEAT